MTYTEIVAKVMERIDEVGVNESVSLNFPIEPFMLESANQFLASIPLASNKNLFDFSSQPVIVKDNGSGQIILPIGFIAFHSLELVGWKQCVTQESEFTQYNFFKQHFRATRATIYNPMVLIEGHNLYYFAYDNSQELSIERAQCLCRLTSIVDLYDGYCDAASWLCASKVLQVMNEPEPSALAMSQYSALLTNFQGEKL